MKKTSRIVFVIFVALVWLMRLWSETTVIPQPEEQIVSGTADELCEEFIDEQRAHLPEPERIIQRSWQAYQTTDSYCASYEAPLKTQEEAAYFRNTLQLYYDGNYAKFWNTLYHYLYQHDAGKLSFLQDSLRQIAVDNDLSQTDFASLIVSFVQDIPYEFVLPEACTGNEQKPCNGNVLFGLYSPAEFVYQLKGDCDTRTLLLYTLLENFGFDAVIFNSREYEHSMLGIDLPLAGDYLTHRGRNYYFWETTNVGWMPGTLPPELNNTDYWKIVLN